jgi:hypothetical protein
MQVTVALVTCACLVLLVLVLILHMRTEDWWPKAIPTQAQYGGHSYDCAPLPHWHYTGGLAGTKLRGHTIGGGEIFAPSPRAGFFILVRANDRLVYCPLQGSL